MRAVLFSVFALAVLSVAPAMASPIDDALKHLFDRDGPTITTPLVYDDDPDTEQARGGMQPGVCYDLQKLLETGELVPVPCD